MIMMNSEQEEGRQKAPSASNEKPKPPPTVIENDIQKFYDELMGNNNSISIQIATNLPVIQTKSPDQKPPKNDDNLEETNLSNLYNRIMSDHHSDFPVKPK